MHNKRTLITEVKCISNLLERHLAHDAVKRNLFDLTGQQMHILGYIDYLNKQGKDVFQKDLETELNVRPSTATAMLKILVNKDYIIRESVPTDARLKKLVLTPKAIEVSEQAREMLTQIDAFVTEGISEEEKELFFSIMDKIRNNLRTCSDTKQNISGGTY